MQIEPVHPKYESFLRDESGLTGRADQIAFPEDTGALAALMSRAAQEELPVTLQGSRTGLVGGAVPAGGLVINLSRMNAIFDFEEEKDKKLLHAEAGATLEAINLAAAPQGLSFMPRPTEQTATAGGMFATGSSGPNALRYGAGHAHVEALLWVTLSGDSWRIKRGEYIFDEAGCALPGGRYLPCKKEWASFPRAAGLPKKGRDLIDFLAGSEGKLGAAAELWLRLLPQPKEHWGVVCFLPDARTLYRFSEALLLWHKTPEGRLLSSAEYYDQAALGLLEQARAHGSRLNKLPPLPARRAAVYLELAGDDESALEAALLESYELFCDAGGDEDETWAVNSRAEVERLQQMGHAITELFNSATAAGAGEENLPAARLETDFTGPPEKLEEYLAMYRAGLAQSGVQGYLYGSLLQNCLHAALLPRSPGEREKCSALALHWGQQVLRDNGLLISKSGTGKLKQGLIRELLPPEALAAGRTLRDFFAAL
ncbi:MAG: FAD-binding oxidoreductase [Firmicutes bacterium]|nr:FAD-binding oxidoreductase [Bacillota bacterium]